MCWQKRRRRTRVCCRLLVTWRQCSLLDKEYKGHRWQNMNQNILGQSHALNITEQRCGGSLLAQETRYYVRLLPLCWILSGKRDNSTSRHRQHDSGVEVCRECIESVGETLNRFFMRSFEIHLRWQPSELANGIMCKPCVHFHTR